MTITATVIEDSISPDNIRLTTLQLRYPRFVHAEFLTHRVFSRNSSSSRAVPVKRLIEDIRRDPAMPIHWGKNQPGMQAFEEHDALVCIQRPMIDGNGEWDSYTDKVVAKKAWLEAMERAIKIAEAYAEAGYHKQIVNRLLEPFAHINVVVTSTNWSNFLALRAHEDAQPEIKALAFAIKDALDNSSPIYLRPGHWHLPYVKQEEINNFQYMDDPEPGALDTLIKISSARCARVSYFTHDGKPSTIEQDKVLYERLVGSEPLHASPMEHQATPDRKTSEGWLNPEFHGNLYGWCQFRKILQGEFQ